MDKGRVITLEGGEGVGKTSLIPHISNWLETHGYKVLTLREPGGTEIGNQIRKTLHDVHNTDMASKTEALLYQAARAQIVREKIWPALQEGKIVLLDRFRDSTNAYQGYARGIGCYQVDALNDFSTGGLKPDIVFYLDIDPEIGLRRRMGNNQEMNRLDNENLEFHKKVRYAYRTMCFADEENRWEFIDANKSQESVLQDVTRVLELRLCVGTPLERKR